VGITSQEDLYVYRKSVIKNGFAGGESDSIPSIFVNFTKGAESPKQLFFDRTLTPEMNADEKTALSRSVLRINLLIGYK
jgi:hypothetical protein